jgi:hypothetical protein
MIRQTRQMTPKRTDAGLLTSDSERFAFFGVIWRILFGCGGAALGDPRLNLLPVAAGLNFSRISQILPFFSFSAFQIFSDDAKQRRAPELLFS